MDSSNQQPNLIVTPPASDAKKSPMEMIKLGLGQISTKIMAPFSKKQTTPINIVAEKGTVTGTSSVPNKKSLFIAIGVGVVVLLLIIIVAIGSRGRNGNGQIATSSPTPAAPAFTPAPNKYASDPEIIKMQNDIQSLEGELGQINIEEANLKPRPYLWDINFKQ